MKNLIHYSQNNLTVIIQPRLISQQLEGLAFFYPTMGINKLIEELGITTKLAYNTENCAVNSDNFRRELRDSIPVLPIYVMEEKKCHDIIDALLIVKK